MKRTVFGEDTAGNKRRKVALDDVSVIDTGNSTTALLTSGSVFTGAWYEVTNYGQVTISINADVASATNGLQMQFSSDGTNVDRAKANTVPAGGAAHTLVHITKYFRIVYTNGGTNQATFRMQIIHHIYKSKELTSTVAQTFTDESDVQNVRAVLVAKKTDGTYTNVTSNQDGAVLTAISSANLTAFDELKVANLTPAMQESFAYNINSRKWISTVAATGTVTQANAMAVVGSGVGVSATATMESYHTVKYRAGQGVLLRFTGLFTAGVAGTTQLIGGGNTEDGFFFGYNQNIFSILHRSSASGSTVDTYIAQTAWSEDTGAGLGTLPVMDWTKGNVFEIQFQFLGFGIINFLVENPSTGSFVIVHRLEYANANTQPSLGIPTLPACMHVDNGTTETDIVCKSGSFGFFTEGTVSKEDRSLNSISNAKTSVTTEVNLLTVRNRASYHSYTNREVVYPILVDIASDDGKKASVIRVVVDAVLGGSPSYTNIDTNTSIAEYDTAGTTVSNGNAVTTITLPKGDQHQLIDLSPYSLHLAAGETITVAASTTDAATFTTSITWNEDI